MKNRSSTEARARAKDSTASVPTTTRVTVDLNTQQYAGLGKLGEDLGASGADVIRYALVVYEYLVRTAKAGGSFSVTKNGETQAIVLLGVPGLEPSAWAEGGP
jgi:hypothetical protein